MRFDHLGFGVCGLGINVQCLGRILCESRIHNSKSISSQSLPFTEFESEEIMRKSQRFSFELDLRP